MCQILSKSLKPRRYVSFRFFKTAAAAILDFRNFKILTEETVTTVELHQHAKFRKNRLNRGRDMAIFYFSRWRPPKFLTVGTLKRVELHHLAKIRQYRSYRSRDMAIF